MKTKNKQPIMFFVACASSENTIQEYKDLAYNLGFWLGKYNEILPVGYAQGNSPYGLMGATYFGYLDGFEEYCKKTSISQIDKERMLKNLIKRIDLAYDQIDEQKYGERVIVNTHNARLNYFNYISDVLIVLPGYFGTFDELHNFIEENRHNNRNNPIDIFVLNPKLPNSNKRFFDPLIELYQNAVICKISNGNLSETVPNLKFANSMEELKTQLDLLIKSKQHHQKANYKSGQHDFKKHH
jgi:predicted Rossmann-fold nucleotide-binding protein